ncbi:glycine cleavage T C-terminal barrel domain-containing protein [Streptomyces sp. A30]|uniref:glycine cleavage T C-terminal barrel domain-containing protein n=1 Tax=Streptomyces sp. A30 TaxID=2789273 RepID=UPI00397FF75C
MTETTPAGGTPSIPHVPTVPLDPGIDRYIRFGTKWEPYEYTDWIDESESWKKTCYIGDWSPLTKLRVSGPDALRFFSDISVNSMAKFDIGQAKHAVFCNEQGKVMGEGILMRIAEQEFRFTSGPGAIWALYRFHTGGYDAVCENVTDEHSIQQVQGPVSLELMNEVTGDDLSDIRFMRFRRTSIDGMEFYVLRQGMSGEVGFEIHGRADEAQKVYARIHEAGQKYGIRRLGGRTKMVNHVEACFPTPTVDFVPAWYGDDHADFRAAVAAAGFLEVDYFAGHGGSVPAADLSELYYSPVELGWGKSVKFDHEFTGRAALEAEIAAPRRLMRTLVWNADDVVDVFASFFRKEGRPFDFMEWPRAFLGSVEADEVLVDGQRVGIATSRCYSYTFREMLSLCVIDVAHAEPGTQVEVVWGAPGSPQKRIRATVAQAPYKADRRRAELARPAVGSTA